MPVIASIPFWLHRELIQDRFLVFLHSDLRPRLIIHFYHRDLNHIQQWILYNRVGCYFQPLIVIGNSFMCYLLHPVMGQNSQNIDYFHNLIFHYHQKRFNFVHFIRVSVVILFGFNIFF